MKVIENVSKSQLSIARYYGGVSLNGSYYYYDSQKDRLIHSDHWKEYNKQNQPKVKQENNQLNIFD